MFNYTFNTWLLSNLLHPLLFIVFGIVKTWFLDTADTEIFALAGYVFLISLFVSIPCLFLGWLCVKMIVASIAISDELKFIMWLFVAPLLAFVEFRIFLIILGFLESDLLFYSLPGIFATAFSVLLRHPQFFKISAIPKIDTNEKTTLV